MPELRRIKPGRGLSSGCPRSRRCRPLSSRTIKGTPLATPLTHGLGDTHIPMEMSRAVAASLADDRLVTVRRPDPALRLRAACREFMAHRDLFVTLTDHRLRVRYKQSALGWCWALLQPLALMLIFTLVFGRIARVPSEGVSYPLFAYAGLLVWSFLATGLSNAIHSLTAHAQLITKVYFPREILPLTYVAAAVFDLVVASSILALLLVYHGHALGWQAAYALPVL